MMAVAPTRQSSAKAPTGSPPLVAVHPALSLAVVAGMTFDGLLCSMVGAGRGFEALCLYLRLTRSALEDALVRLDLPTPHDRALRSAGPRGWSAPDTTRLIAWRVAGFHPRDIGARLGRSADAVRRRARLLGVPTPPRAALRRAASWTLPEPASDHFAVAFPSAAAGAVAAPAGGVLGSNRLGLPDVLRPGAGEGAASRRPVIEYAARAPAGRGAPSLGLPIPSTSAEPSHAPDPTPPPPPLLASERPGAAPGELWDLGYVRDLADRRRDREAVTRMASAYFGGQCVAAIARRIGVTAGTVQSLFCHLEVPRCRDRSAFGEAADDALGARRLRESGWEVATCADTGVLFFRHRSDRGVVTVCRRKRFQRGALDRSHDLYRRNTVALAAAAA